MRANAVPPSASQHPSAFIERSNWRGIWAIARDYALIGVATWISLVADYWPVYLMAVWLIGLIQLGLGETLTHEASHGNLFRTRWLNRWSELFCCLPFFFALSDYRREHAEHHRLLNTDREQLREDYRRHGLLADSPNLVWLWFVKPVVGYAGLAYLRSLIGLTSLRSALKVAAFWICLFATAAMGGWLRELALYWLVPLLWSFASFFYWSEIEDHFRTSGGTRSNVGWTNWLTHNNGYHEVHHRHPRIPWYRLREAHEALCGDSPDVSRGFLDTYRQISRTGREQPHEAAPAA